MDDVFNVIMTDTTSVVNFVLYTVLLVKMVPNKFSIYSFNQSLFNHRFLTTVLADYLAFVKKKRSF